MKSAYNVGRRGMTLAGLLIVIAVIAILSTMMIMSSTESVSTAKATKIIANLHTLKRAIIEWYADNREKVSSFGYGNTVAGMVTIGGKTRPIQEWNEKDLQLSRYISGGNISEINLHKKTTSNSGIDNSSTNLVEGCYGICDGGTVRRKKTDENGNTVYDKNGKAQIETVEYHRSAWYVGYCFKSDEGRVRDKIRGMMKTEGVFFGTADAQKDTVNDNNVAVWMRVL